MASGFLTLADGRCFAPLTWAYDEVLRAIAQQLEDSAPERMLRDWLLAQLPGPGDIEPRIGPWIRASNNAYVDRELDVRDLTPENQKLFHDAALLAAEKAKTLEGMKNPTSVERHLVLLADLIGRTDRGEPPLDHSMCTVVMPFYDRKIGPGW